MFSALLLRPLALVLSVSLAASAVNALQDILYTSSVTYCSPPDALVIQEFDVTYFRQNSSIKFDISATSIGDGVNATANVIVNAYGERPISFNFYLCEVLGGALCPLPKYNFTASTVLPLPPTFRLDIPPIAYKIPDLEAFAQLNLTQTGTGKTVACVQSTLSNGWSTHQPAASSGTAAFALVALVSSFVHSFFDSATSPSVFRVWDIFYLFQHIATTGMLHLNYPSVYTAFSTNFAWSLGLFTGSSVLQHAIERMRYMTGSRLPTEVQEPDEYADRKLSPYNILASQSHPVYKKAPRKRFNDLAVDRWLFVEPVTIINNKDTISPGIPTYVNSLGVPTGNAFMSVFFAVLFLVLLALACAVAGHFVVRILSGRRKGIWYERLPDLYRSLALAFGIRLVLIVYLPITIFAFFQWTLKDSWLATLLSVLTFLACITGIIYPTFLTYRMTRRENVAALYTEEPHFSALGALYAAYRQPRWFQFATYLVASFTRSCFISFGHDHGLIQVIGLVVVELLIFGTLVVFRPGHTRGSDVLSLFLSTVRIATISALIPFVNDPIGLNPIPRVVVGIAIAIVCSVGVIVLFVNFFVNLAVWKSVFRHKSKGERERAEGEVIHSHSPSNDNIVNLETAEAKKEPAIETRSPASEEAQEQVPEPCAVPSITTTGKSTSVSASIPKEDTLAKNVDSK